MVWQWRWRLRHFSASKPQSACSLPPPPCEKSQVTIALCSLDWPLELPDNLILMVCGWVQRGVRAGRVFACAALLAGCAQLIHNDPVNQPLSANPIPLQAAAYADAGGDAPDDMVVALTFSGGGMRAAAFSYGVLTGFDETRVKTSRGAMSLLDHIDFISGVSGGSVLAAYYGLKRRQALSDFRERFLLANPEEHLQTNSACLTSRADSRAVLTIY